jgi:hypothetical protein
VYDQGLESQKFLVNWGRLKHTLPDLIFSSSKKNVSHFPLRFYHLGAHLFPL